MITGTDVLKTERRGRVYVLTINREERRNAFSAELLDRLAQEMEHFDRDDELWAAILTGAGDVAFCAGHDMKEDLEGDVRGKKLPPYQAQRPHPQVWSWKPVIGAINGYCLAGGWYLAQCCDVRIAAEHATFGIPEAKWNLPAPFGAFPEYQISFGVAAEMLLWGRSITAQRAYEIGFVNEIVPKDAALDRAMEWAEEVCALGQDAVRAHKQLLYRGRDLSLAEREALGNDLFYWYPPKPGVVMDATEGPRAFAERRKPRFDEKQRLSNGSGVQRGGSRPKKRPASPRSRDPQA